MALDTTVDTEIVETDIACTSEKEPKQATEIENFTYTTKKAKVSGRGFSVTGIILGIISSVYAVYLTLVTIATVDFFKFIPNLAGLKQFVKSISFGLAPTVAAGLVFIFTGIAALAIVYSIAAKSRGYAPRIRKTGMILGIASIALYILPFILFFDTAFNF